MENHLSSFALSIFLLFNSIALCLGTAIFNFATDKHALLTFKNSVTSDPDAILRTNWSENTPVCDWIGVTCGTKHQRVTALDLSGFDLAATVAPHLGNLTFLRYLDISSNNFNGFLPIELSKLRLLKVMNVGVNSFIGEIPTWLGTLPKLEQVYLHNNSFSGIIPLSLFNSSKLKILHMGFNTLSGNIPKEIGSSSSSLKQLWIFCNHLSGSIPKGMFNLSSMREIRMGNNSLSGSLPSDMCNNMPNINTITLSYNQLSGNIPTNIWECKHLEILSFYDNNFSGNIPFQIGSLSMLKELYLAFNDFRVLAILVFIRRRKQNKLPLSYDISPVIDQWRRVSYIELERGTNYFSVDNILGRGSFGSVFQATLSNGLQVAAKVFNLQLEGGARSFDTETKILSNIRHRNLVDVIGCCTNTEFKALILVYMPNGSLDKWLYSNNYLMDLIQRLKIAIDIAAALEYLHHGYLFPVVHCDIKPSNVLLDQDMIAHLSDFGISKLFEEGEAFIRTQTLATIGYAAPEFGTEGKVSTNGDVYSFGIMMLEMFTGKKPTDDMFSGEVSLRDWVSGALQKNPSTEILAASLLSGEDRDFYATERCVSSIFELAMKCAAVSAVERINMIEAASTLHKIKATIEAPLGTHRLHRP